MNAENVVVTIHTDMQDFDQALVKLNALAEADPKIAVAFKRTFHQGVELIAFTSQVVNGDIYCRFLPSEKLRRFIDEPLAE